MHQVYRDNYNMVENSVAYYSMCVCTYVYIYTCNFCNGESDADGGVGERHDGGENR